MKGFGNTAAKQGIGVMALAIMVFAALPAAAGGGAESGGESSDSAISVAGAWIRASVVGDMMGAGYATLENNTGKPLSLVGVEGDIASRIEMHNHVRVDGLARMAQVEAIELLPGDATTLAPGGLHLMFMGIEAEFQEGDTHNLTLLFDAAPPLVVEFLVQPLDYTGTGSDG